MTAPSTPVRLGLWRTERLPYNVAVRIFLAAFLGCVFTLHAESPRILPPPAGKLYHGFYWGGVGTDTHDPTEHDVTAADVVRYEQTVGAKTTWVYFSDNWFESRKFPREMCGWIRDVGEIPYIRLMLRSDVDQRHSEKTFSLQKIIAGEFDADLRAWARDAKAFGSPILIEWGTEPNGNWFAWNGKWNGGPVEGPKRYIIAYRHIVDLMRAEGADNLTWVWHVNWYDEPERKWNAFENYFPGTDYCDWVALSAYGPTTPLTRDSTESFAFKMREAYPRLTKLAPGKPLILAEFGCDLHNRHVDVVRWARSALEDLLSNRWPAIVGFCWWNEGWQNDDHKKHDTDMIVLHDPELTRVFREEFAQHHDKIQETIQMTKSE
ncbi:MAG TPA: glycosyl hydrolase [Chthoniobacterales bacterium]|nr:glycosyl hydrolase [Chthoniobacterales bacterium]